MTAETLKPFITPTSAVDNFPAKQSSASHSQRKTKLITIGLSVAALALAAILLSLTIWHTTRVSYLETELAGLKRVVDSLQQRLGINYLEELDDFEREYQKALIEDPNKLDDSDLIDDDQDDNSDDDGDIDWNNEDDDEDNEDDTYIDYADLLNKYRREEIEGTAEPSTEEADGSNASNDDNVFDDFKNYNDSKKKKERKSRSIAEARNDIQTYDVAPNKTQQQEQPIKESAEPARRKVISHSRHFVADHVAESRRHSTPLRMRTSRRRRLPSMRSSGESLISAKSASLRAGPAPSASASAGFSSTAAAHFHLNRKVPHHNAPIRLDSYHGDMYIGHATASDNAWQRHFSVENGVLTVLEPGLYYVYAQICYNNTHDQNGFIIFQGQKPFLQCLNTVPTNMPMKVHTCHTSGLMHLEEQESIHLRDIHSDRNVMLKDSNNRSYFGLIKV